MRSQRLLVLYACIGFILISSIEGTIVATVMPEIVGDLGGFDLFSWVFTGYLLTQAVIIPIYGRLADVHGRRKMLLIATVLFALGSILCGCAWSMLSLIVFRVAQGIGAGGLVPISQTVVGDLYTPVERARISGYLSSMWAIGSIIGPLLGAFLIAHTVWSMVFWINVPIAAVAALMLVLWLKEEPQPHARRIDYGGAVLLTAGSALLMFALVEAGQLDLLVVAALIAVGLVLLVWFFRLEQRSPDPMLPVTLLKNRMLASASLGGLFSGAILMGATAFISVFVQGVMGRSALTAGLVLTTPSDLGDRHDVRRLDDAALVLSRDDTDRRDRAARGRNHHGDARCSVGSLHRRRRRRDRRDRHGAYHQYLYGRDSGKRRLGATRRRDVDDHFHETGGSGRRRRGLRRYDECRACKARRQSGHRRSGDEPGAPQHDSARHD